MVFPRLMKRWEAGLNAINESQLKAEFADADIDYDPDLNKSENREIAKAAHYTRYTDACVRASFDEFQYEEYLKEIDDNNKEDEENLRQEYKLIVHQYLLTHPVVKTTRASKCIPAAYHNLEKVLDNSQLPLDPKLLTKFIVKLYKKHWTDSTIIGYLPPENKNPVKQEAGRASGRERRKNGFLAVRTDLSVTHQKPMPPKYCLGCDKEIKEYGRSSCKFHGVACRMVYYRRRKKQKAF